MNIFIRDWEVVSPAGVGKQAFTQTARKALAAKNEPSVEADAMGPFTFKDFDKKKYLGKKGVRGMDGLGAYATVASHLLVCSRPELLDSDRSRVGVVLGTGTGSVKSQIEFIRDLRVLEQVEWVDPIQFPQTVMNCAAGQVSIWHRFTGVNTTVSGGYHSGITAFEYAANALKQSRVDRVLVGCAEEYSPYSQCLLPVDGRDLRKTQRLGEGCVIFLAERQRTEESDIEVIGLQRLAYFNRYDPQQRVDGLVREITNTRRRNGLNKARLRRICFNRFSKLETEIVHELGSRLTDGITINLLCSNGVIADCMSATTGLQFGLLLAVGSLPDQAPGWDLVLTFDPSGGVAMSILRYGAEQ